MGWCVCLLTVCVVDDYIWFLGWVRDQPDAFQLALSRVNMSCYWIDDALLDDSTG